MPDWDEVRELCRAHGLGELLTEGEGVQSAIAALRLAVAEGEPDIVSEAAFTLGDLLDETGDFEGAKAAFLLAAQGGDRDHSLLMRERLGLLYLEHGDTHSAISIFREVIAAQRPDSAPMATRNLGQALAIEGDIEGAEVAYRAAMESMEKWLTAAAAVDLADLLVAHGGEREEISALYDFAISNGDPDQVCEVYLTLALRAFDMNAMDEGLKYAKMAMSIADDEHRPTALQILDLFEKPDPSV